VILQTGEARPLTASWWQKEPQSAHVACVPSGKTGTVEKFLVLFNAYYRHLASSCSQSHCIVTPTLSLLHIVTSTLSLLHCHSCNLICYTFQIFSFVNLFSVLCTILCNTLFAILRLFRLDHGPQLLVMVPPAQRCPIIIVTDAEGRRGTRCKDKSPLLNNPQLCDDTSKNSIWQQLSHWQASQVQE